MPVIKMPEKEPEPSPTQALHDTGKPSDKDIIDQIQEEVMDSVEDNEPLIQVTERVIPEEDDVFGEPPTPKVKPIIPADDEEGDPPPPEEFKPTGKRKYTRKAPMSQKQKDHLARIRKIAAEKRAKERELKAQEKIKKEEEKEEALEELKKENTKEKEDKK